MQCSYIKSGDSRCNANAMRNSDYCFTHNPDTIAAKKQAVIKGGESPKKNSRPVPPVEVKNTKDVVTLLSQTVNEVRQCLIDLRVANCLGYLAGHLIKAMEVADLEERVAKLETEVANRNKK